MHAAHRHTPLWMQVTSYTVQESSFISRDAENSHHHAAANSQGVTESTALLSGPETRNTGWRTLLLPCLLFCTLGFSPRRCKNPVTAGDDQAKAANADIGLRKQRKQPVFGTQKDRRGTPPVHFAHGRIKKKQKQRRIERPQPTTQGQAKELVTQNSHQYLLRSPPGQRNGKCSCKCTSRDFSLFLLFPATEASWAAHCRSGALLAALVWLVSGKDPVTDSEQARSPASLTKVLRWTFPTGPLQR